ncbi:hypothetical protein SCHPADRAFT_945652 [Schizopora paradoxa]|uniref:Uncharacterized protein n=1 Tax=Schizopora paradoxa TaxID=27342 RepID=A0A0H2R5B9_9AGAM|nr:hypothetical protein SCHPADRAFT_945652 [Schizopora paradoxa]
MLRVLVAMNCFGNDSTAAFRVYNGGDLKKWTSSSNNIQQAQSNLPSDISSHTKHNSNSNSSIASAHYSSSISSTMSSSSSKDYSAALGSLMSTYGTSGAIPTPIHHSTSKSRRSSRKQRDEVSKFMTPPTPSTQSTTSLLHSDNRRSSAKSDDALGHLQSQYGLGTFGMGMPAPMMPSQSTSKSIWSRKTRSKSDTDSTLSTSSSSSSKVGSLLTRYGFSSSSRDSR